MLNEKVPASIDIYAIEINDNITICENISPSLWSSIIKCSEDVLDLLIKHNIVSPDKKIIPPINSAELLNELYSEEYETDYADTSNNINHLEKY